jgi:hypothetical protein
MKLEGEVGEINLVEQLVELGRERFTGAVRFESDGIIKILYFKGGDILSASTNDRTDSVDEILLRANKVTREHVKQALAKRKESETLGDALLGLGFITRKELTWARRVQVIGVIRSIGAWTEGSYTMVADYLPKREEGTLFSLSQVLVELIVTDQDRAKFDRALTGGEAVLQKTSEFEYEFRRLGLNQDAEEIAAQIDGTRSAAEIAAVSGKDTFNVYKLLSALESLGLLVRARAQVTPSLSAPLGQQDLGFGGAVADAEDVWGGEETQTYQAVEVAKETTTLEFPAMPMPQPPFDPPQFDLPVHEAQPYQTAYESPQFEDEPLTPSFSTSPGAAAGANSGAMPAWDGASSRTVAQQSDDLQWGFDEAQIEAARRASVPMSSGDPVPPPMAQVVAKASRPNRWVGILLGGVAIIILAFAGLAGWNWWQNRQMAEQVAAAPLPVTRRPHRQPPPVVPVTGTTGTMPITPIGTTLAGTMGSVPPATTSTTGAQMATTTHSPGTTTPLTTTTVASAPTTTTGIRPATATHPPAATPVAIATATAPAPRPSTAPPRTSTVGPTVGLRVTPPPAPRTDTGALPRVQPRITTAGSTPSTAPARLDRSGGAPTITNTPAASSSGETDVVRRRYDAMASEFLGTASGAYTIQFELVCETASLTRAIKSGGSNVWFTPIHYRTRPCYRVFWGHYDTRNAAVAGLSEVPADLRGSAPAIVHVPKP